jgi:hypothetical protein
MTIDMAARLLLDENHIIRKLRGEGKSTPKGKDGRGAAPGTGKGFSPRGGPDDEAFVKNFQIENSPCKADGARKGCIDNDIHRL